MASVILEKNLAQTFFKRVQSSAQKSAILQSSSGTWKQHTWGDYGAEVYKIAKVLEEAGVGQGDRVAILSNSRPEWAWADVAILSLGAVTVPIYPSLLEEDVAYILGDSGSDFVFAEDSAQVKKLTQILEAGSHDFKVKVFQDGAYEHEKIENLSTAVERLSLEGQGFPQGNDLATWSALTSDLSGETLASIVYTSGTSGVPKGVKLSHNNFLAIIEKASSALGMKEDDTTLLFLPLAHILGRVEHMLGLGVGWANAYAENLKAVMDNLIEVRPTVMVSVPRIYEKIYSMLLSRLSRMEGIGKALAQKAVDFSFSYSEKLEKGQRIGLADSLQFKLFDRVLYSKVRARFGGRLKYCISGGAPFSPEISRFFHTCGVLILEGYGLTETTGPLAVNRPNDFKIGTVGQALEGVRVRIAEDGEILVKGPVVMGGYFNKEQDTAEVLNEGELATGDVGQIDEAGFVKITDRKKDIIVTAGGKNIAPQRLESKLLEDPLFTQAIVVGDKQKYLGALVALSAADLKKLAKDEGVDEGRSFQELQADPAVKKLVMKRLQKINRSLASFETIKKLEFLPRELSVEEGELTPSLKVKRKYCVNKYEALVSQLFQ